MTAEWALLFSLTILPMVLFFLAFHKCWLDEQLVRATLGGGVAGATASLLLKFILYPVLQAVLGVDLRTAIAEAQQWWAKTAICIFMVGGVEEGAKLAGILAALVIFGVLHRPPAAFLAALGAGLGFSALENLDYFSLFGMDILVMRELVSTTGHLVFTGLMGLALGASLHVSQGKALSGYLFLLGGFLVAATSHGLFNLVALESTTSVSLRVLGCALVAGLVVLHEGWLYLLKLDRPVGDAPWMCASCGLTNDGPGRFCQSCGSRHTFN